MCICQKGFTGDGRTCTGRRLENDAPYSRAVVTNFAVVKLGMAIAISEGVKQL